MCEGEAERNIFHCIEAGEQSSYITVEEVMVEMTMEEAIEA